MTNEKEIMEWIASEEETYTRKVDSSIQHILAKEDVKFLTLSGPSCSGKTTTAHLLQKHLGELGHNVIIVSIDDFYRNRDDIEQECESLGIPVDVESARSIDLTELDRFVSAIRENRTAYLPRFDFVSGERTELRPIEPKEGDIYLFEGIQAVYPEVTAILGRDEVLRFYISVEDEIVTETGVWHPRDVRLLRRLLRDSVCRGTTAEETFEAWGSVIRNELVNVVPYKEICDERIESGLAYELRVMKEPITELLSGVADGDDHKVVARLLTEKLQGLEAIPKSLVPAGSVLREFIGN